MGLIAPPDMVRIGSDESAIVPLGFGETEAIVHYCQETAVSGYILCNGTPCVACDAGKKRRHLILVPVYLPCTQEVALLPVKKSRRPYDLLPQLERARAEGRPVVLFASQENQEFRVSTANWDEDKESRRQIGGFKTALDLGLDLKDAYRRIDNDKLAEIPEFARMLRLKAGC